MNKAKGTLNWAELTFLSITAAKSADFYSQSFFEEL
jgi:hypothetical protein